jgi:hypothetical protein
VCSFVLSKRLSRLEANGHISVQLKALPFMRFTDQIVRQNLRWLVFELSPSFWSFFSFSYSNLNWLSLLYLSWLTDYLSSFNHLWACLDNLMNLHPSTLPLVSTLLNGSFTPKEINNSYGLHPNIKKPNRYKVNLSWEHIKQVANQTAQNWNLNEDQIR